MQEKMSIDPTKEARKAVDTCVRWMQQGAVPVVEAKRKKDGTPVEALDIWCPGRAEPRPSKAR